MTTHRHPAGTLRLSPRPRDRAPAPPAAAPKVIPATPKPAKAAPKAVAPDPAEIAVTLHLTVRLTRLAQVAALNLKTEKLPGLRFAANLRPGGRPSARPRIGHEGWNAPVTPGHAAIRGRNRCPPGMSVST